MLRAAAPRSWRIRRLGVKIARAMWTLICEAALDREDSPPSGPMRNGCTRPLGELAMELGERGPGPTDAARNSVDCPTAASSAAEPAGPGLDEPSRHAPPVRADSLGTTVRQIGVYMHPGRMLVGHIDLDRARLQFDLACARLFHSFDEAERACAGRAGFLLEVCGAHGAEDAIDRSVLFVEGLRPV